jgi:hypothetical protein
MHARQVNVKMPANLYEAAESFAKAYGYRNVQDLAMESMREKIFEKSDFDESFTEKEIGLVESLIEKTILKNKIAGEKELLKALE